MEPLEKNRGGIADTALNTSFIYQIQKGYTSNSDKNILFYATLKPKHVYWIGIDSNQPLLISYDGNINNAWTAQNKATFINSANECTAVFGLGNNGNTNIENFRIYDVTELKLKKQNKDDLSFM